MLLAAYRFAVMRLDAFALGHAGASVEPRNTHEHHPFVIARDVRIARTAAFDQPERGLGPGDSVDAGGDAQRAR